MADAWRAYLEMALGLTEAQRKRAQKVVGDLANRGGATAAQLQGLVEDLMTAGMANREALTNIVRHEVDRALGVVGLATVQEVDELTGRVRDLERQLRDAKDKLAADDEAGAGIGGTRLDQPAPLPHKLATKKVAKKAVKATPNAMPSAATPSAPAKKTAVAPPPAKKAAVPPPAKKTAVPPVKKTAAVPEPAKPAAFPEPVKKAAAKNAVKKAPGTADAPTAGVRAAAAGTALPPADDAGPVDSEEAGFVDQGEAGLTPAKKAAPAKKIAAKKAPAKKAAPGTPEASA